MVHGDAKGLRLPPRIAPIQAVIVPIWRKDEERDRVRTLVDRVLSDLTGAGIRAQADWRDQVTPGFKFNDWELKGVPLRIEIGPRDADSGQVVLVRRDTREKSAVPATDAIAAATDLLEEIQQSLLVQARAFLHEHTGSADSWEELTAVLRDAGGFVWVNWCDSKDCETRLAGLKATVRAIPLVEEEAAATGHCVCCGSEAQFRCVVARSY
jgi:prolyl-tRNA synthetase